MSYKTDRCINTLFVPKQDPPQFPVFTGNLPVSNTHESTPYTHVD
jgi:hypothetical protein